LRRPKVGAQSRLYDGLGVVVVVLLPLHEGLDARSRNDARSVVRPTERAAYKVSAQASL
jgi:hypothetical protein